MQINLIPDTSVSSAPPGFTAMVQAAADIYEQDFPGNYTVNITYGWGTFDNQADPELTNANSGAFSEGGIDNFDDVSYATLKSWLSADAAVASLPASYTDLPDDADNFLVSSAQEKALGEFSGNSSAVDGSIGFNTSDVNSSTTVASLEGAALQEIGHSLGWLTGYETPNRLTVLDLFRYGSPGNYQWTGGQAAYFSLDGGKTDLANFLTSGDYSLFSNAGDTLGDNDPFALPIYADGGSTVTLTSLDIEIFNILGFGLPPSTPTPPSPTADMIMNNPSNGDYEIYNISGNQILAANPLGQVGAPWTFVGMGTFQAGDSSDMLLRNASTGAFEAYYISGNTITNAALIGTVGINWNFAGTGDFDGQSSLSELLLRNAASGAFELYQVAGGGVLSGSSVAAVGNNFSVKGFGNFSGSPETQMMMQDNSGDASNGQLELYTYQPGNAAFGGINVGKVGSNLSIVGTADLLGNGETQMVMQQNNGNFWLYTYQPSTNSLSGTLVGAIGSNFHEVGFGPLGTSGQDEMLMQDAAGDFEVYQYNASLNAFVGNSMGAVGAPWVVDGIAADPPGGSASTAQLVQAMASMGGGTAVSTASGPTAGAQPSQPTLLTTPQPA